MQTTTTTAVENKGNVISSFFNSIWQKGNRVATILAILMTGVLIGVVYHGLHRPHCWATILCIVIVYIIIGIYTFLGIGIGSIVGYTLGACAIAIVISTVIVDNSLVINLLLSIAFVIGFIAITIISVKYLWNKHRKYLPSFIATIMILPAWLTLSFLSTTDSTFEWYSKTNGKAAEGIVFVPLGFGILEDKYFPVAKLEPGEIPAKISIFNSEKSGWKKEEKFDGNLRVEFRVQNYEGYKVILGREDFHQIDIRTTSREEALEQAEMEIWHQLGFGLKPENIRIIMSGIWS